MDALQRLRRLAVCLLINTTLLSTSLATEEGTSLHFVSHLQPSQWPMVIVGMVSVTIILSYAVFACTDCYNSEVSTDCHPASASGAPKWGGAGGYSSAATTDVNNSVMTAGFTGEVVVPDHAANNAPLPYALVPSGVPEAQGFRGYSSMEMATAPSGYGSTGAHQSGIVGYGGESPGGYYGSTGAHQSGVMGYGGESPGGYYGGAGAPQPALAGYGVRQSDFGGSTLPQNSLPAYGGMQQREGGVAGQRGGWNTASAGSSRPLPGAHVPLMSSEAEEPPPPYFPSTYQH